MNPYQLARQAINAAHAGDPRHGPDGSPAEMIYADRIEGWVSRLVPGPGPLLLLAARCQHLERWSVPRDSYPAGRAGYLAWRRSLYGRQAERARGLLLGAGIAPAEADEAAGDEGVVRGEQGCDHWPGMTPP